MKYKANPVEVDAFKIVSVAGMKLDDGSLNLATEDGVNRRADSGMLARYMPVEGDYWVIQSDGYEYLNPRDVFERKYSPVVNLGAEVRRAGLEGA